MLSRGFVRCGWPPSPDVLGEWRSTGEPCLPHGILSSFPRVQGTGRQLLLSQPGSSVSGKSLRFKTAQATMSLSTLVCVPWDLVICVCVCLSVYGHGRLQRPEKDIGAFGVGITGRCEPPDVGA